MLILATKSVLRIPGQNGFGEHNWLSRPNLSVLCRRSDAEEITLSQTNTFKNKQHSFRQTINFIEIDGFPGQMTTVQVLRSYITK
jgi:hypothetical protein